MTKGEILLHLQYSAWASAKLVEAAEQLPAGESAKDRGISHHSIEETLAHAFQADRAWLSRVTGAPPHPMQLPDEEPHTLAFLKTAWPPVMEGWKRWAETVDDFDADCAYHDLRGNPHRTPLKQIVMHVVNHASIHFGQVTALLRQLGVPPPRIDLIIFYRELP